MRHLFASVLIFALTWSGDGDQTSVPARLDAPVEGGFTVPDPRSSGACGVWRTIEQIARRTQVRVGFENAAGCPPGGPRLDATDNAIDLTGASPRRAFDEVTRLRPELSWRDIAGVVVLRPVATWDDTGNPLNRAVSPFAIENVHPHLALHALLQHTQPVMFHPHTDVQLSGLGKRLLDPSAMGVIDRPITANVPGSSLLAALNAITVPFHGIWQVGYTGQFMHIEMRTLEFQEGSTLITASLVP